MTVQVVHQVDSTENACDTHLKMVQHLFSKSIPSTTASAAHTVSDISWTVPQCWSHSANTVSSIISCSCTAAHAACRHTDTKSQPVSESLKLELFGHVYGSAHHLHILQMAVFNRGRKIWIIMSFRGYWQMCMFSIVFRKYYLCRIFPINFICMNISIKRIIVQLLYSYSYSWKNCGYFRRVYSVTKKKGKYLCCDLLHCGHI